MLTPGNLWDSTANELPNKSESWRYECEIRQLLVYRTQLGLTGFRGYFSNPKFNSRRELLARDFYDQWKKGNRGTWGDWR
jgi:hypothetical protein